MVFSIFKMDLSKIIAKYVNCSEEVKFGSYAPGSLCYNICKEINTKPSKKSLSKFKYQWCKNNKLKESVTSLLNQKENSVIDCANTNQSSIFTCSMSELSDSVCKMSINSDSSFNLPR